MVYSFLKKDKEKHWSSTQKAPYYGCDLVECSSIYDLLEFTNLKTLKVHGSFKDGIFNQCTCFAGEETDFAMVYGICENKKRFQSRKKMPSYKFSSSEELISSIKMAKEQGKTFEVYNGVCNLRVDNLQNGFLFAHGSQELLMDFVIECKKSLRSSIVGSTHTDEPDAMFVIPSRVIASNNSKKLMDAMSKSHSLYIEKMNLLGEFYEELVFDFDKEVAKHHHIKSLDSSIKKNIDENDFVVCMAFNDPDRWVLDIFGGKGEITEEKIELTTEALSRESLEEGGFKPTSFDDSISPVVNRSGKCIGHWRCNFSVLDYQKINKTFFFEIVSGVDTLHGLKSSGDRYLKEDCSEIEETLGRMKLSSGEGSKESV